MDEKSRLATGSTVPTALSRGFNWSTPIGGLRQGVAAATARHALRVRRYSRNRDCDLGGNTFITVWSGKAAPCIVRSGPRVGPIISKPVLIVDDSAIVRKAMHLFFDVLSGWEVGEAADGTEAIQKSIELKPELILLDFCMPRLNGIEAASVIKRMMPDSYVVLFTVFDDALSSRLTAAVGVDLIVPKAEGLTGLLKAVQHLTKTTGSIKANLNSDHKRAATEQA